MKIWKFYNCYAIQSTKNFHGNCLFFSYKIITEDEIKQKIELNSFILTLCTPRHWSDLEIDWFRACAADWQRSFGLFNSSAWGDRIWCTTWRRTTQWNSRQEKWKTASEECRTAFNMTKLKLNSHRSYSCIPSFLNLTIKQEHIKLLSYESFIYLFIITFLIHSW